MKKLAALLTLGLSFGLSFPAAAQQGPGNHQPNPGVQQPSNDPTPAQIFGLFGALVNAANGGQSPFGGNPGGHNGGYPGNHPGGHNGGYPGPGWHNGPPYYPPVPQPQPWPPQPGPWQGQFQTLNSIGSYSSNSDAASARDMAMGALSYLRLQVMESRVEYNSGWRYVIKYTSQQPLPVAQYRGGSYSSSSDAKAAADRTAEVLKTQGKVIVEMPVFYSNGWTYIVGYVSLNQYPYQNEQLQKLPSIGSYSSSSEAAAARDYALRVMSDFRIPVMESRVEYNSGWRFEIVYNAPQPLYVQQYRGGSYSSSSDARNSAEQTASAMAAQRNIVIEKPVFYNSGWTYIIGYISRGW